MTKPILLAWSGGKDSALALERITCDPRWRVEGLLTSVTTDYERVSIHGVRRSILQAQASRSKLPLIEARMPAQASNAVYETSFAAALDVARTRNPEIATIAFGDLYLTDVRSYRENLLARLGWRCEFPLWGEDTRQLARQLVSGGYRATLCCVDTQQLDAHWCGREFDGALLDALPAACDPCGENGEFHTCVHAMPMWAQPLEFVRGERVLRDGRFEYIDLIERRANQGLPKSA